MVPKFTDTLFVIFLPQSHLYKTRENERLKKNFIKSYNNTMQITCDKPIFYFMYEN